MARSTCSVKLFPVPGTFQDRPLTIYVFGSIFDRWSEIKDWAAWQFDATEDEVDTHEVYWGGEYGDDDSREVLTIRGKIVGAFDDALTPDQWAALFDADVAECASFSEQVREAARARAATPIN
jgi:hypothetical protein